jgi:large subunit ribosomal protein L30
MAKDTINKVKVTLIKSIIGKKASHKATVVGLGLKKINHTVELKDTPEVRGMIKSINYLLKIEN